MISSNSKALPDCYIILYINIIYLIFMHNQLYYSSFKVYAILDLSKQVFYIAGSDLLIIPSNTPFTN